MILLTYFLLRPLRSTVSWSTPVANLPGRQSLCSAGSNRLVVPPFKLSTIGTRAFPVASPADITSVPSLSTFRQRLKTDLFRQSFTHLTV